jgi:hypothetical protein
VTSAPDGYAKSVEEDSYNEARFRTPERAQAGRLSESAEASRSEEAAEHAEVSAHVDDDEQAQRNRSGSWLRRLFGR